jgi:hypothetical protein
MDPSGIGSNGCLNSASAEPNLADLSGLEKFLHEGNRRGWRKVVLNFTPS